ncbi:peptidoglycan DD-metalloendopeptidase family protein [Actinosynnema sp. NPDC091369]
MSRRVFVTALVAPLIGLVLTQGEAAAAPNFQMPFPCNQVWEGQTRTNHSPANSVDFNRANDDGDPVVASAAGTVSRVANEGSTSYGRWVEIDHGSGWRTRYAHLSAQSVSVGQSVRIGQKIGNVGTTGGSTGPHLHYEQRLNGVDQKITFNGTQIYYWGTRSYTSRNSCSTTGVTGTVGTDSGASVTVRSGPGTQYAAVGSVANGATVTISCQAKGETITGKYGTTNLWDKIGAGYISDAYVYTGSDGQVAPSC